VLFLISGGLPGGERLIFLRRERSGIVLRHYHTKGENHGDLCWFDSVC
jgi:hypothetical protein